MGIADEFAAVFASATKELAADKKRRQRDAASARRRAAARHSSTPETSVKEAVFAVMTAAVAAATGNGQYMVSARTLFYQVRPLVQSYTDKALEYGYFSQTLLTEYRDRYGPIRGLYYDPRGILKEPHTGTVVKLGTVDVANYQLPEWTFDKILYVEKKGLEPIFSAARFGERYDVAMAYGEGYAVEAARELLARAEKGRDYTILVLHDADPYGYEIARTLGEATKRMPGHHVEIVDLGLSVADAIDAGLEAETFTRRKALPWDHRRRLDETECEWFEGEREGWSNSWICRRVELNAFTAPDLVAYVEAKLEEHDATAKIVPPEDVVGQHAADAHRIAVRGWVTERMHDLFNLDQVVETIVGETAEEVTADPGGLVTEAYEVDRATYWRTAVTDGIGERLDDLDGGLRPRLRALLGLPDDTDNGGAS